MYAGVDPGLAGAVAAIDDRGRLLMARDMPTVEARVGKTIRKRIDEPALIQLFRTLHAIGVRNVAIEKVGGIRGQGAAGAFVFGYATGVTTAAAMAAGCVVSQVSPQTWQAHHRMRGGKHAALGMARARCPGAAPFEIRRGRTNEAQAIARAEAFLIADWARTTQK